MSLCIPLLSTLSVCLFAQADETRTRYEALAGQLKFFPTHAFAHGRSDQLDPRYFKQLAADWLKVLTPLSDGQVAQADLVGLLNHPDPKVRTLALASLYQRDDPKLLPHLAALLDDREKTVPELAIRRALRQMDEVPTAQDFHEQTVGQVASVLVRTWLEPSGYEVRDFTSYWAARKDRTFCAGWFLVRLNRAGQDPSADPKRLALIRAVRKEVDALPAVDRDWTLLWLAAHDQLTFADQVNRHFATLEELLAAAQRLGPARLMELIQDRAISTDPDLAPKDHRSRGRDDLILWVLRHAGKLLRPEDAPTLLAAEKTLRGQPPECVIAAAELQPDNARRWLREAFNRYPGDGYHPGYHRAALAAGLWRLVGESELDYLTDWFYGEKVNTNPHTPQTQVFLSLIQKDRAPANRKLVARLITDPRLDKLDYQSLRALIEVVNGWSKAPLISYRDLYPIWERGSRGPESPADFQVLARWRDQLKKSVPEWNR